MGNNGSRYCIMQILFEISKKNYIWDSCAYHRFKRNNTAHMTRIFDCSQQKIVCVYSQTKYFTSLHNLTHESDCVLPVYSPSSSQWSLVDVEEFCWWKIFCPSDPEPGWCLRVCFDSWVCLLFLLKPERNTYITYPDTDLCLDSTWAPREGWSCCWPTPNLGPVWNQKSVFYHDWW